MPISISRFIDPEFDSQEYRALKKALEDIPNVKMIGTVDNIRYYQVTSSKKLGQKYPVRIWQDADGESWVECFCVAAYPPEHPHTKLIAWFEKCCYHQAAAIIYDSQECAVEQPEILEDALPLDS
jgi:hypothetical protein